MYTRRRLQPLLDGHWYDAIAAVLDAAIRGGLDSPALGKARQYAVAAKRVLDLDAEDFGQIAEGFARESWKHDLSQACFPPDLNAHVFVCGPTPFVELVADTLVDLGHDPDRIRTERFGPTGP